MSGVVAWSGDAGASDVDFAGPVVVEVRVVSVVRDRIEVDIGEGPVAAWDGAGVAAEEEEGRTPGGVRVLDEGIDLLDGSAAVAAAVVDPIGGDDGGGDAFLGLPVGERLKRASPRRRGDDHVIVVACGDAGMMGLWVGLQGDSCRVDDHLLELCGALQGFSRGEAGWEVVAVDVGRRAGNRERQASGEGEAMGGGGVVDGVDGDDGDGLAGEIGLTSELYSRGWVRGCGLVGLEVGWGEREVLVVEGLWRLGGQDGVESLELLLMRGEQLDVGGLQSCGEGDA